MEVKILVFEFQFSIDLAGFWDIRTECQSAVFHAGSDMEHFIVLILLHVGNLADPPLERSIQELISPSFDTLLYKDGYTLSKMIP